MILVYKTNKGRTFEIDSEEVRLTARGCKGKHMIRLIKWHKLISVTPRKD